MLTIEECQRQETRRQEGSFSLFSFHAKAAAAAATTTGGVKKKVVMMGQKCYEEEEGERLSAIVRIHRVIHYICNCVIVSGHFTWRHKASEPHGSGFLDAAATVVRKSRFSRAI